MKTALERLGLPADASTDEVEQRWRRLRSLHHPDHGGDAAEFHELLLLYRQALEDVRLRPCPACLGVGHRLEVGGFTCLRVRCQTCGGTGRLGG